jgi:hypothetical protein
MGIMGSIHAALFTRSNAAHVPAARGWPDCVAGGKTPSPQSTDLFLDSRLGLPLNPFSN